MAKKLDQVFKYQLDSRKMNIKGRFYYKQTLNGNLIGEFSNNKTDENLTESGIIRTSFTEPFIGNYDVCWYENGPQYLKLEIIYRTNNHEIYKLTWRKPKTNEPAFEGEGFIVDNILIGNYENK